MLSLGQVPLGQLSMLRLFSIGLSKLKDKFSKACVRVADTAAQMTAKFSFTTSGWPVGILLCREVGLLKINVERAEWDVLAGIQPHDWAKVSSHLRLSLSQCTCHHAWLCLAW
jgi:hypothetical protein